MLILLGVVGSISNRQAVLLLSVAPPHSIEWLLAGQKVVGIILQHFGVANVDS